MAAWHTPTTIRAQWPSAPKDDDYLQELLDTAREEIEAYGADYAQLEDPDEIPTGWRVAHRMHTQGIYEYLQSNTHGDNGGIEGVGSVRVYPMDANIRARIRPNRGLPQVG